MSWHLRLGTGGAGQVAACMKRALLHPSHPERVCWGCDKYCRATDLACGNGKERTPHPVEMFGDDWQEDHRTVNDDSSARVVDEAAVKGGSKLADAMGRTWFVLQHVAWEHAGLIAEVARERGMHLELRRMDEGAQVPAIDEVAGVIVMGGPMGVRDAPSLPFLGAEMTLLRAAVEREVPVLGVCLGAQLLAAALGARVDKGSLPEVGFGEVHLTADGRSDPVLGEAGPTVPVVHWHEDTFEIPTPLCPCHVRQRLLEMYVPMGGEWTRNRAEASPSSRT